MTRLRELSVARQLFVLLVCLVVVAVPAGALLVYAQERVDSERHARQVVLAVARTLSRSPDVVQALRQREPTPLLEPLTESVRRANGVDYVGVLSPEGIRYTHPNPRQIGQPLPDDLSRAAGGHDVIQTYPGRLGTSVRAVVPAFDGRRVVGLVSAVMTQPRIGADLRHDLPGLFAATALALAIAAAGSVFVSSRLKRQTLGLGPTEITRMYEHHDAVLHAMTQGLLVVDEGGRLLLANDGAARLLGLTPADHGLPVGELPVPVSLRDLLRSGRTTEDEVHLTDDRVLLVTQRPTHRTGRQLGTVTVLRDHTEVRALSGELASVRGFAESLRAQAHEAANRLHTVITLVEVGQPEKAVEFGTAELASAQELTDRLLSSVGEPAVAALLLGKTAAAHEKGVQLVVTEDTALGDAWIDARDLVTLVGNLVDNAVDAALAAPPPRRVVVTLRHDAEAILVRVADSGAGLEPDVVDQAFVRGWSTKPGPAHGRGLGLALVAQVVHRYRGSVDVSRDDGAVFTVRLPHPAVSPVS